MYYNGKGTDENIPMSISFFEKASELENQNAKYSLGKIYIDQNSPYYDFKKGQELLLAVAKKESYISSFANYSLGKAFLENQEYKNIDKAITHLSLSAEQDNEQALYTLGKLYQDTNSSYYNLDLSLEYFNRAAEKGNSFAQYKLGKYYYEHPTGSQDFEKAFSFLHQSAKQNNTSSLYQLGIMYANKEKPFFNMEKAILHFDKAAASGNDYAMYQLGKIY